MSHTHMSSPKITIASIALAGLIAATLPVQQAKADSIQSQVAGAPLTLIENTPDLNCNVMHKDDIAPEFYGGTACATLVAVDGILFGPAVIPAGDNASPRETYTQINQQTTGAGTFSDPYRTKTEVKLGDTGLTLVQVDTYLNYENSYSTEVKLINQGSTAKNAIIYRAGDCYLNDSDLGYGTSGQGWVACQAETSNRILQWVDRTQDPAIRAKFMQSSYSDIWATIGRQEEFTNSCAQCLTYQDNGAGLSWKVNIPGGGEKVIQHSTAFLEASEFHDTDGDGLPDKWEREGLDLNGDGEVELPLHLMGADPDIPDIFVEVDWMEKIEYKNYFGIEFQKKLISHKPTPSVIKPVVDAFAKHGIRLHVDAGPESINYVTGKKWGSLGRGNPLTFSENLGQVVNDNYEWGHFDAYKEGNFDEVRKLVFRYSIFANKLGESGSSGIARIKDVDDSPDTPLFPSGGQDFIVAYGAGKDKNDAGLKTDINKSGTFMHELGHTLGLGHGGGDVVNYKPNYPSIMNYSYQLTGIHPNEGINYSEWKLPTINKLNLHENIGLDPDNLTNGAVGAKYYCDGKVTYVKKINSKIDFNCSGEYDNLPVVNNGLNSSGSDVSHEKDLFGFNDWKNLVFKGGSIGALGAEVVLPSSTTLNELDVYSAINQDIFAPVGSGTSELVDPTLILSNTPEQSIYINILNLTGTGTKFDVTVSSDIFSADFTQEIDVEPSTTFPLASKQIAVPVRADLAVGEYEVTVTVSGQNENGPVINSETYLVEVKNLTPDQIVQLTEALELGNLDQYPQIKNTVMNLTLHSNSDEKINGEGDPSDELLLDPIGQDELEIVVDGEDDATSKIIDTRNSNEGSKNEIIQRGFENTANSDGATNVSPHVESTAKELAVTGAGNSIAIVIWGASITLIGILMVARLRKWLISGNSDYID